MGRIIATVCLCAAIGTVAVGVASAQSGGRNPATNRDGARSPARGQGARSETAPRSDSTPRSDSAPKGPSASRGAAPQKPATQAITGGLVSLIDEAEVAAEEPGKLVELKVKKGDFVQAGQELGKLDDEEAAERVEAAKYELDAAEEQAKNDIRVRAAEASAEVSKAEEAVAREIKRKSPGAVTDSEIRKLELATLHSGLQIDLAKHEFRIAGITMHSKQSQLDAAEIQYQRRHFTAPIDGVVVETMRHKGEWLTAGQPLLKIVRMDRLEIEGMIPADQFLPEEVAGRPATVNVTLTRDLVVPLAGEVTFVSPTVEDQGTFRITVEFNNVKSNGHWVLRPGLSAEITIDTAPADEQGLQDAVQASFAPAAAPEAPAAAPEAPAVAPEATADR